MNPGTTIIIIIGIITFLLYLSKALKPHTIEKFQVMGIDEMRYKAPSNLTDFTNNTKDFNKLISNFSTPDFNDDRLSQYLLKRDKNPMTNPIATPMTTPMTNPITPPMTNQITTPKTNPVANLVANPVPKSVSNVIPTTNSNVGTTLPANTPASVLKETPAPIGTSPEPIITRSSLSPDNTIRKKDVKKETKIVYVKAECPPMPDMSQYIRKDSIPCWGCNLR